jgi:hypothetical protein
MADEVTMAMAAALASSTVEAAVAAGKSALAALVRVVRRRFERVPDASDALEAAVGDPGDAARVARLAVMLARVMAEDAAFGDEVRRRWVSVEGDIVNRFSGRADKVVQARDIHGGVNM